jgi:hypothetical protein
MPQQFAEPSFPVIPSKEGETASADYDADKPASQDDDDDLLARVKGWYRESEGHIAEWREDAREDFAFVAGDQWDEDVRDEMEDTKKAPVTFNRIGAIVDAVRGLQINNVEEVAFKPSGVEDAQIADTATELIAALRRDCDAQDEETMAFDDCVICGLGVLECRIDEDNDRKPIIERLSSLETGWDVTARKNNFIDRRYDWIARRVDRLEAGTQFPDADGDDLDADWAKHGDKPQTSDTSPRYLDGSRENDDDDGMVTLIDVQWWERKPMMRVTDKRSGLEEDLAPEEAERLVQRSEQIAAATGMPPTFQIERIAKKIWYHAIVGKKVLYRGELPIQDGQGSRKFITGKIDRSTGMPYGLVRNAKDPQRLANKFFTQGMHILNSNAKSGLMFEDGAIDDEDDAAEELAKTGAMVRLAPGALTGGKVQQIPAPQLPQASVILYERAMNEINQVTGVNLETLGLLDREQAGIETHQRKQSTVTNLAWCFDALRMARKDGARSQMIYAMEYTPEHTLQRMVPQEMAPVIAQMRLSSWVPYDVVVDEAPTSPNAKERAWALMQGVIGLMAQQGMKPQTWIEVLRMSPMPNSFLERLAKTMLAEPSPQEQQEAAASKQLLARMQAAEAGKDEADAHYKNVRAIVEQKEADIKLTDSMTKTLAAMKPKNTDFPVPPQQGVNSGRPAPRG